MEKRKETKITKLNDWNLTQLVAGRTDAGTNGDVLVGFGGKLARKAHIFSCFVSFGRFTGVTLHRGVGGGRACLKQDRGYRNS